MNESWSMMSRIKPHMMKAIPKLSKISWI